MKVAVVIPAYNEEARIGAVLETVLRCRFVQEVIVVSDGSTDGTFQVASAFEGVKAMQLERNHGKGGALRAGVCNTEAEIVVFFDADLEGLLPEHVEALAKPLASCNADMCIGVFRGGRWNTTLSQVISPNISGQRAVKREMFLQVPGVDGARYGVEVKINKFFKRRGWRVRRIILHGVTHTVKEAKLGKLRGTLERARMYAQILRVYFFDSRD